MASSPSTGAQAALLAASGLDSFLRAGSAFGVAIILPSSAVDTNRVGGTTVERLRATTGHYTILKTIDRWAEPIIDYSSCISLPAAPDNDDPANVQVELGPPGAITEVREALRVEDSEGWYYEGADAAPRVCLVGATFHDWLETDRVLRVQVVTRVMR